MNQKSLLSVVMLQRGNLIAGNDQRRRSAKGKDCYEWGDATDFRHPRSVRGSRQSSREQVRSNMKANDIVRYSKPVDEMESRFQFILLRDPENGRADIQLICDDRIMPVETVDVREIELAPLPH